MIGFLRREIKKHGRKYKITAIDQKDRVSGFFNFPWKYKSTRDLKWVMILKMILNGPDYHHPKLKKNGNI